MMKGNGVKFLDQMVSKWCHIARIKFKSPYFMGKEELI